MLLSIGEWNLYSVRKLFSIGLSSEVISVDIGCVIPHCFGNLWTMERRREFIISEEPREDKGKEECEEGMRNDKEEGGGEGCLDDLYYSRTRIEYDGCQGEVDKRNGIKDTTERCYMDYTFRSSIFMDWDRRKSYVIEAKMWDERSMYEA